MQHKNLKGGLTISRPRGGNGPEYVQIELNDELSGTRTVTVRVEVALFAEALFGLGYVNCEFDLYLERVGMQREHKEEFVPLKDSEYYVSDNKLEIASRAFAPFEVDGWKGRVNDLFNHHRRTKDGARVTFVRYVPVDAGSDQAR